MIGPSGLEMASLRTLSRFESGKFTSTTVAASPDTGAAQPNWDTSAASRSAQEETKIVFLTFIMTPSTIHHRTL